MSALRKRRRQLLAALAVLAIPRSGLAQATKRIPRLTVLSGANEKVFASSRGHLESALRDLGWRVGATLEIRYRYTEGAMASPAVLEEVLGSASDVLLVLGGAGNESLHRARGTAPVVTLFDEDPVARGYARSLARPGGKMTGLAYPQGEQWDMPKQMELCREAFPSLKQLGVLTAAGGRQGWRGERAAIARRLGIELVVREAAQPAAVPGVARGFAGAVQAVWVELQPNWPPVPEIVRELEAARLPSIGEVAELVEGGGTIAYGVGTALPAVMRQLARMVDRLLRGAKPGDVPIESPPSPSLIVNTAAARRVGYEVPASILLRAETLVR